MIMNISTTNETIDMNNNSNILISKGKDNPENMKLNIIEKDKKIFDYMKLEKDYINTINNLKSSLEEKNIEILKLNQEKKELEYSLQKKDNLINMQSEKYLNENNNLKNIIKSNQTEIEKLKLKIINNENIIKLYDENKKDNYEINTKKNNEIIELINQIKKNENLLKNMKSEEKILKEENKKIPSLKRKITDLENIINQYKKEIIELKNNNIKIINSKEELNEIINTKNNQIKKEKINEQYILRLNYKIDYLSKELNNKNIENEILDNQNTLNENDLNNFFNIFIKEFNTYLNYLWY